MEAPRSIMPTPDPARVEALARDLSIDDDAQVQGFGETVRLALADAADRILAETRSRHIDDSRDLLRHALGVIEDLRPTALVPRTGLAGLFDSRGRRLRRFRERFDAAGRTLKGVADDLGVHAASIERRLANLDTYGEELRALILDAEAHLAAAPRPTTPPPVEGEDAPAPHHIYARIAVLGAAIAAAVRLLPLGRGVQNTDCFLPAGLTGAVGSVDEWAAAWRTRLGLDRRRPRKVRPDIALMESERERLAAALQSLDGKLAAARARRAAVESGMATAAAAIRRPV